MIATAFSEIRSLASDLELELYLEEVYETWSERRELFQTMFHCIVSESFRNRTLSSDVESNSLSKEQVLSLDESFSEP